MAYGGGTLTGILGWPGERGPSAAAKVIISGPCSSLRASTTPSSSLSGATTVVVTARAAGCEHPLYEFWMLPPGAGGYQLARAYSDRSTFTWNPVDVVPGTYRFGVWARDAESDGLSVNPLGRLDVLAAAGTFTVSQCATLGITLATSSPTRAGGRLNVTAHAGGCGHALYRFWVLAPGSRNYQMLRDYSPSETLTWTTSGLAPGVYRIGVWARDRASSGVDGDSLGRWDTLGATTYRVG